MRLPSRTSRGLRAGKPRQTAFSVGLLVAGLVTTGCHAGAHDARIPSASFSTTVGGGLTDAAFAESAHRLLRDGGEPAQREALLRAVVGRQLEHAAARFAANRDAQGADAVVGACLLIRAADVPPHPLGADGRLALDGAIRAFSAKGDEGRTLALLAMKRGAVDPGGSDARAIDWHADAIRQWATDTRASAPTQQLGDDQRRAVSRALLDATASSLAEAERAVIRWIERAFELNQRYQETRELPDRSEALDAFRALRTGAYVLAALHVREGDANGALQALDHSDAARLARPAFLARLRAAAETPTADLWRQLARDFHLHREDSTEDEPGLDPIVLDAAVWGASVAAYRLDPTSLAASHLLADQLLAHGMPEVAPLVLVEALGADPAAASLSGALDLVSEALSKEAGDPSVAAARRIVRAAEPLLTLADHPRYRNRLHTTSAEVRRILAGIELRAGHAREAHDALAQAQRTEPTVWGMTALASLERQLGDSKAALVAADRAYHLSAASASDLEAATARLLSFEILRDLGDAPAAQRALDEALASALAIRNSAGTGELAVRAEATLARVLDAYGETERAGRAMARALELADRHRLRLAQTILAAIGRAVVHRDLPAARSALGMGIKADIDRDSIVYGALWVALLERLLNEKSDGKVDRVLAEAVNAEGWTMRLARWSRGSLTDAELLRSAQSHSDRVEAEFYAAMRARATGDRDADERLRRIAQDPLIDLFEVRLARDLLAPRLRLALPANASLP